MEGCRVTAPGSLLDRVPLLPPPLRPSVYTIQIQRTLGLAGAGDTALFFGYLGASTALLLAPLLLALQLTGAMDLWRVAPAALGLACFNGAHAGCRVQAFLEGTYMGWGTAP